jgi:hypothetical protein
MTFHRLLFFAESPHTPWPQNPAEYTAFAAEFETKKAIDLRRGRFKAQSAAWENPLDYSQCQALAAAARAAAIQIIRYRSVRDPKHGANFALLNCRVFKNPQPVSLQTWRIRLYATGVQAICESPKYGLAFGRDTFAADPRIAALNWER